MRLCDLIENFKRKTMSWPWLADRLHNKKNKRAAVSSDTDGKQVAPVKKRRRDVKEEEEIEEEIEDGPHMDRDKPEDCKKPPAVVKVEAKHETEVKEDIYEPEDCAELPAAIKKEEEDQTEENYKCDDDQLDKDEPKDSKQASAAAKEEYEDEVGFEYPSSMSIVKRKYSMRSLSQQNNNKSTRSKPLRRDKGSSSTSLGEVNRSPVASSDEDEFGRCIESAVDEESHISDSEDGIIDQDEGIFEARWNNMYERLRAFKESHGHCELFWVVERFTLILNTPLTLHLSLSLNCRQCAKQVQGRPTTGQMGRQSAYTLQKWHNGSGTKNEA
jgi:hypothetical protein